MAKREFIRRNLATLEIAAELARELAPNPAEAALAPNDAVLNELAGAIVRHAHEGHDHHEGHAHGSASHDDSM